jgi:hypothetical protein
MSSEIKLDFGIVHDEMASFMQALKTMQAKEVLAGFPQEEAPRKDEDGKPNPITNAALGYIHNMGAPEQNIPARPFMVEGIESKREAITNGMEAAGIAALDGKLMQIDQALNAVGLAAKTGIQMKILDGPFEPLAESTLKNRVRTAGSAIAAAAQTELDSRAAGNAPDPENARPLNATGQMRNAVNYVLREK